MEETDQFMLASVPNSTEDSTGFGYNSTGM
jgi:hypothetical protein